MYVFKVQFYIFIIVVLVGVNSSYATSPTAGSSGTLEWKEVHSFAIPANPVDIVYSLDGKNAFILTEENTVLIV